MSRPGVRDTVLFGFGAVLFAILVLAGFRHYRPHNRLTTTAIISSTGQTLNNFFDGIKADSRYSLAYIKALRRPACGKQKATSLLSVLEVPTVYAQGKCPQTECSGDGWDTFRTNCNTGGPCNGTYLDVEPDFDSNLGYILPGIHCSTEPECGCEAVTCSE